MLDAADGAHLVQDKAVFYWWKIANFHNEHFPRARFAGLDPDKSYRVEELNRIDVTPIPYEGKTFTGRFTFFADLLEKERLMLLNGSTSTHFWLLTPMLFI